MLHLVQNKILYCKQFGFQQSNSTEHAIIQLIDQISYSLEQNKFTLGVFIDLSKAFDTVDHNILLNKLEFYGVKNSNLKWFESYLHKRQQFIGYDQNQTKMNYITCGVPQGSILGPLLFLIYVNDLNNVSDLLDPIMFADDTNLFYSHSNIKILFDTVNRELCKLNNWFHANKLSLNVSKTKYTFFHKLRQNINIPLVLPNLSINGITVKRERSIKFLGVFQTIENKISKNIGMLFKAKFLLNQKCLKSIYFSFIHCYLTYANIAWGSTHQSKLKKLYKQQKHASRIIFNKDITTHSRPLLKSLNALNVYQLNIFQTILLMYKCNNNSSPVLYRDKFTTINHRYPTRQSTHNFRIPERKSQTTNFSISFRGPYLWNNYLSENIKTLTSLPAFKKATKQTLLNTNNELNFFR